MLVFEGPSSITLSLVDSKKQHCDHMIVMFALHSWWGAMYAIRDLVGPSQIFNLLAVLMSQLIVELYIDLVGPSQFHT